MYRRYTFRTNVKHHESMTFNDVFLLVESARLYRNKNRRGHHRIVGCKFSVWQSLVYFIIEIRRESEQNIHKRYTMQCKCNMYTPVKA